MNKSLRVSLLSASSSRIGSYERSDAPRLVLPHLRCCAGVSAQRSSSFSSTQSDGFAIRYQAAAFRKQHRVRIASECWAATKAQSSQSSAIRRSETSTSLKRRQMFAAFLKNVQGSATPKEMPVLPSMVSYALRSAKIVTSWIGSNAPHVSQKQTNLKYACVYLRRNSCSQFSSR